MAGTNTSDEERQALLDLAARALLDGDRRYTADEVCARTGCDRETADLLWRAMGFPDVPDGEVAFTDRDVAALQATLDLEAHGLLDAPTVRAQTRVMSQALATIAAAHLEITEPGERDVDRLAAFVADILPNLDDLLVYLYRRHLLAAVERSVLLGRDDTDHELPPAGGGLRRPRGVHPRGQQPRGGRARRPHRALHPGHGRRRRRGGRPRREDDRRRGHVHLARPGRRRPGPRCASCGRSATTTGCRRCGPVWPADRSCCATATSSATPST